jgi:hypothetical protein
LSSRSLGFLYLLVWMVIAGLPRAAELTASDAETSETPPAEQGGQSENQTPAKDVSPPRPDHHLYQGLRDQARTSMFGITAEGYKFVYLIDRSASMGDSGSAALSAAKAELLASLRDLARNHRFGLIFYNETVRSFNPTGGRAIYATDQNKDEAAQFVASITPLDGTRHDNALKAALRQAPDVIFWLSDADKPKIEPAQIERIDRMAAGVTIHAFQFGSGPAPAAENFMAQIARATGGQYKYIDVTKLPPAEKRAKKNDQ